MADIIKLYESQFNPRKYIETYYLESIEYEFKYLYLDFLHRLFSEEKVQGKSLLDVGSGPNIQSVISASRYVNEIYFCDYLKKCRDEVQLWLQGDPLAIDHNWQLQYIAQKEGHGDIELIQRRIRKSVKGVLPCNVLKENPLEPELLKFDIITSSLCLEVFPDLNDYFMATKNMASLLHKGGRLAVLGTIKCSTYSVGDAIFPSACKDALTSKRAFEDAGLKIVEFNEYLYKGPVNLPSDGTGCFTLSAIKL